MEMNKELIAKAKETKTVGELLALAKENDVELTAEEAETYFEQLHPKTGELSDEELDNVAGGGCYAKDGHLLTTIGYKCRFYEENPIKPYGVKGTCCRCKYWDTRYRVGMEPIGSPLKCLNPRNMRRS